MRGATGVSTKYRKSICRLKGGIGAPRNLPFVAAAPEAMPAASPASEKIEIPKRLWNS
jgi:hypothetical protein